MQRLNKLLAHLGVASRRGADEVIAAGRIWVNGDVVTEMGRMVDPAVDDIRLDGERLATQRVKYHYLALYKPRGVITTVKDPQGRATVADLVPREYKVVPVGRLDAMSEGLILLTNDGDLANELTHPRHLHEKEYRVKISGTPVDEALSAWRHGMYLLDEDEEEARAARRVAKAEAGATPPPAALPPPVTAPRRRSSTEAHRAHQARLRKTLPAIVKIESSSGSGTWLRFTLTEGRNRQIRRMIEPFKHQIHRLVRTRVGPIRLGELKAGLWRQLSPQEVAALKGDETALAELAAAYAPRRASRATYKEGWARPKPKADRPHSSKGVGDSREAKRLLAERKAAGEQRAAGARPGMADKPGGDAKPAPGAAGPDPAPKRAGEGRPSGAKVGTGAKVDGGVRTGAGAKRGSGPDGPKSRDGARSGPAAKRGPGAKPSGAGARTGRAGGKDGGRAAVGKRSAGRG